jgi:hypothetical protein
MNRDTESVVALTPNIKLVLAPAGSIGIDPALNLGDTFLVLENELRHHNDAANHDRADWYKEHTQTKN